MFFISELVAMILSARFFIQVYPCVSPKFELLYFFLSLIGSFF